MLCFTLVSCNLWIADIAPLHIITIVPSLGDIRRLFLVGFYLPNLKWQVPSTIHVFTSTHDLHVHPATRSSRHNPPAPAPKTTRKVVKVVNEYHSRRKQTHPFFSRAVTRPKHRMGRKINVHSIEALEEQIKQHESAIIKLKRSRNWLLNVSTLPPEVLGNIFRWNVTLKDAFGCLEEGSHNFLLVCHHWFEVASRTPELWTFWGNNLEDWEERYLSSSVGAPLDLVLALREPDYSPMPSSVNESHQVVLADRAASNSIRRVHLWADNEYLLASIISPLLSPCGGLRTSNLESLILRADCERPLDVSFFAHSHLPKLQHLELFKWAISSWAHLASQPTLLTTLTLSPHVVAPTPTMSQLLSILASTPYLHTLVLDARALPDDDSDEPFRQVPLRHLEELQLEGNGDVRRAFGFLHRLDHPNRMGKLWIELPHCTAEDIPQTIGPYLRDYVRRRGRSPNGLGVSLSIYGLIAFGAGDVGELHPSTSKSGRMTTFFHLTIWGQVLFPDDVRNQLTLDLIGHIPREEIAYFRTCERLAAIKDLRVRMSNLKAMDLGVIPLYPTFSVLDSQGGSQVEERIPPSLQLLFLGELILNGYDLIHLIAFLHRRASSGNALDSLRIEGPCHMCLEVSLRVRSMVRRLKIDEGCLDSWCPFGRCLQ